ncbi:MAG: radical SAM protein [bacterium]|nr:radical SAM protein [bacterium]
MDFIIFVPFPDYCFSQDPPCLGAGSISGYLSSKGYEASVVPVTSADLPNISQNQCDIIGISILEDSWELAQNIAAIYQAQGSKVIAGGVFTSVCPEEVLQSGLFDAVCIGDGELIAQVFIEQIMSGRHENLKGLVWNDKYLVSEAQDFSYNIQEDLSLFQSSDFGYKSFLPISSYSDTSRVILTPPSGDETGATCEFMFSRGCGYRCTYCHNSNEAVQDVQWLRFYDLRCVIADIERIHQQHNLSRICILDDDIISNYPYFRQFVELYSSRIHLPYRAFTRPEKINARTVKMLKDSGCYLISMGLESANQMIREKVLNRKMSTERIAKAMRLCRENGIQTIINVMIGIPGETEEEIEETISFLEENRPDFVFASIFTPYRGTKIYNICKEAGWDLRASNTGGVQYGSSKNPYFVGKESYLRASLQRLQQLSQVQPMVSSCKSIK